MPSPSDLLRGALGTAAVAVAWLGHASATLAADPTASSAPGGDPRSAGEGPGLVGDPLLAIVLVVALGILALGATLLYVRLSGGPRSPS
jgi:hypothetical protein